MIVVSGMPRSGTSLMMRMLDAGGIPAVTDGRRVADEHNPHGYFEDARVMRLARDSPQERLWLEATRGKAVKIIYRLLPYLPPHIDYRIVFMDRAMDEVYASQQALLESKNEPAPVQLSDATIQALSNDLTAMRGWMERQPNIACLTVPYAELVSAPSRWTPKIAEFLDGGLDEAAMAGQVDPALYRQRGR